MEQIVDRLKDFISQTGLSPRAIALQCGLKQNTLSRQLAGSNELSLNTILAIARQYPELSLEWLLRGDGHMLISEPETAEEIVSPATKKISNLISTLTQLVNDQESQIEKLQNEIKNNKQQ